MSNAVCPARRLTEADAAQVCALMQGNPLFYRYHPPQPTPESIRTDMTAVVRDKYDRMIAEGLTPIPRWGTPEDIASAVSVLASGRLTFCTGQVLDIDGGFHIRRL